MVIKNRKFTNDFISLADIYVAYRKAKSDAFYDGLHPNALAFTKYENNLKKNLNNLFKSINNNKPIWHTDIETIGSFLYVPKSIDQSKWSDNTSIHYRAIDPIADWNQRFISNSKKKLVSKYRLIIAPTVDYQIISALWILKVGHKFESKLDKRLSYGNRLRRFSPSLFSSKSSNGKLNIDSLGLFAPYFSAYQRWRENGLKSMRSSVENGQNITAITMDLAGFYHNIGPRFLLRPSFLKKINIALDENEYIFTSLLLDSLDVWYSTTPDTKNRPEGALPVGLSASKIISNILLYQLDYEVQNGISPIYYGRYVDDIFIVVKTPEKVESGKDVMRWLAKSISSLKVKFTKDKDAELRLSFNYADDSDLFFTAKKQKIFSLSSKHGLDLVDQIASQIRAQSSEYRLLPEVPETASLMANRALLATPDATLAADALRKADVVSVRRLGFSILVRDIECYSTDLARSEWRKLRQEFYGLVHRYLLTPIGLFEFSSYYPRVFRLMIANHDFEEAEKFIENLCLCFEILDNTTINSELNRNKTELCRQYFEKSLLQTAIQASTAKHFSYWTKLGRVLRKLLNLSDSFKIPNRAPRLKKLSHNLLISDWGSRPYKDYWYYEQKQNITSVPVPRSIAIRKVIRLGAIRKFREEADLKAPHWPALAFPTRPLTIQEIALIAPSVLHDPILFSLSIKGLRGAGVTRMSSVGFYNEDHDPILSVPKKSEEKIYVALTNIETTPEQWEGAASGKPDRSIKRYQNICGLINNILKSSTKPDYVVFPECSIPRRWAIGIASKLAKQGISLLCGIEYYENTKYPNQVRNDCLISLTTRWPGYNSNLIYMQPKLAPSHHEKRGLSKLGKKQQLHNAGVTSLPIYEHGNYLFGVLICSDLTNPNNRVRYQGKVDSLFVLEWNKDVKTFSFLVEGTAHDVHTFVVQVNNRLYGDSRIRAPYREDYKRDSVRLKGGISDYFVIGEIDFKSLRKFQRRNRMTEDKAIFKPVPIGFKMSEQRKITR